MTKNVLKKNSFVGKTFATDIATKRKNSTGFTKLDVKLVNFKT